VSRHCGSNRVTALALAMVLLVVVTIVAVTLRPPLWLRASLLVAVPLVFTAMRHALGNWAQARLFMATDFRNARITTIRQVRADPVAEKPPVHFVETVVS
jgi:hypothetical protein